MSRLDNKTLTFRAWWGDADWIKPGFTSSAESWGLNTLRLGQLVIMFGIEDHG